MAIIHDKYVIELKEVIKGYGNDPQVKDPLRFPCDYKFYEIDGVAICENSFKKMKRLEDVAIPKADYETRLTTDMATIKQLSSSVKALQKANSKITGAYDKLKSDYEARLKDNMVAMLTEIQLEIEECEDCGRAFHLGLQMASNIIQQKISLLRSKD